MMYDQHLCFSEDGRLSNPSLRLNGISSASSFFSTWPTFYSQSQTQRDFISFVLDPVSHILSDVTTCGTRVSSNGNGS